MGILRKELSKIRGLIFGLVSRNGFIFNKKDNKYVFLSEDTIFSDIKKLSVCWLCSLIFVLFVSVLSSYIYMNRFQIRYEISIYSYEVKKGDTLWSIAKNITPKGKDVREIIFRIEQINCLSDKYIYEGEVIYLPRVVNAEEVYYVNKGTMGSKSSFDKH